MKTYFYYGAIRKSIIKFLDIFNDIKVAKYDSNGSITKYIDVPLKYSPKQKYYTWAYNRTHEKRYPSMGAELTSVEFSADRISGKYETVIQSESDSGFVANKMAVPYDLTFNLYITTEYMHEMDQINEQLMPFFADYVFTKVSVDDIDLSWDMRVSLESATIDQDVNIPEDDYRNLNWVYSFRANTYLLKPTSEIGKVKKVINKIYTLEDNFNARTNTEMPSGAAPADEEIVVIGYKDEDGTILARYEIFW